MTYSRARAPITVETPVSFTARDEFDQSAGALAGKTLPVGGTWAGFGDADDFSVVSGATVQRTAVSDGAGFQNGRFAIAGTTTYTNTLLTLDFMLDTLAAASFIALVARFTDTSNYMIGYLNVNTGVRSIGKRLASTTSVLGVELAGAGQGGGIFAPEIWYTIRLHVDTSGRASLWVYPRGANPGDPAVTVQDANFVTGTLSSGRVGFNNQHGTATAAARSFDNFAASAPAVNAAIFSTQSARFLHDIALRENAAGTSEGRVPVFEGKHLTAPPATRAARKSRIVVSARRFDVDSGLPDSGIADNLTGSLSVTPRVRLVSG